MAAASTNHQQTHSDDDSEGDDAGAGRGARAGRDWDCFSRAGAEDRCCDVPSLLLRLLVLLQHRLEAWVVTQRVVAWFDAESPGREHCRDGKEKL